MLNNFCEEQYMEDKVGQYQEKILQTCEIPKWMNVKCPFCHRDLPLRSIRSVSMKFNTRNLGDIVLEIFCVHCSKMDTLYFKSETNNISDFIALLSGNKEPKSQPLIEEDMYKMGYNNVVEKMIVNGEYK